MDQKGKNFKIKSQEAYLWFAEECVRLAKEKSQGRKSKHSYKRTLEDVAKAGGTSSEMCNEGEDV